MNNYIATFFSHYDALIFFEFLRKKNVSAKLMPVPRKISASCGTCVSFTAEADFKACCKGCEPEAIYKI